MSEKQKEELVYGLKKILHRIDSGTLDSGDLRLLDMFLNRPEIDCSESCTFLGHDGETLFAVFKGRGTGKSHVHRAYKVGNEAMCWHDPANSDKEWCK